MSPSDFILHLPLRYEDETEIVPIREACLRGGHVAQVIASRCGLPERVAGMLGAVDLAYVDGLNTHYQQNHEDLLPLVRKGGVIVYDNVLWKGRVVDPDVRDEQTVHLRDLNALLRNDARVSSSVVRLGDGLALAVAIDRHLCLAAAPRLDGRIELVSSAFPPHETVWLSALEPNADAPWSHPLKAVLRALRERGVHFGGFNAAALHAGRTGSPGSGIASGLNSWPDCPGR